MSQSAPDASRSALVIVYLTVFIDLLGFGIILPLLPYYALKFGASGFKVGVLMMSYSAAQFVGAPAIGRLSDHYGRRPVILWTLFGSALSLAVTGFAETLWVLILARAIAGLFGGSISAAQAYIADVTAPEQRSKYMGLLGASIGMGFVFGPAIGAGLSAWGLGGAAFFAAALAASNLVFAFFRLKESRSVRKEARKRLRLSFVLLRSVFKNRSLRAILGATFGATFGFVVMETTYALLGSQRYAMGPRELGFVFTFLGIIVVIVQGGLIGRLTHSFGEQRLALTGLILMACGLLLVPAMPNLVASMAALALLATGQAMTTPSLAALLSRLAGVDDQGGVLGFGQSCQALARCISPLIAGALYDLRFFGPYILGAVVCLVAAGLLTTPFLARAVGVEAAEAGTP